MQGELLDAIEAEIRKHSVFDREEKYVANVLWIVGTYLLGYGDLRVFDAFPMLAFMSPEPASGKSRALKVTELLSHNALSAGKYTTAALLSKIDQASEAMLTICLDEIDTIFAHGKDNSDLIQLFNLGYERGAVIVRSKRFGEGLKETPAFCPKAFAGLKVAKIPEATKTRTIVISMRPKGENEIAARHIDLAKLKDLKGKIEAWVDSSVIQSLKDVELSEASFLNNRSEQIWEPLLAIAKITSDHWYQRALAAAQFFTTRQASKDLTHKILLAAYRVFKSGRHLDKIHSSTLLQELHDLGIPKWIDQNTLLEYLSSYDPEINTRQMKIGGVNRNGYEWHKFINTFSTYISDNETVEVEKEIGLPNVSAAPVMDTREPLW